MSRLDVIGGHGSSMLMALRHYPTEGLPSNSIRTVMKQKMKRALLDLWVRCELESVQHE